MHLKILTKELIFLKECIHLHVHVYYKNFNENIFVCSDFKCRVNDKQDKNKNYMYLINLLKQLDLVEIWDREHPS